MRIRYLLLLALCATACIPDGTPLYRNPASPVEARVQDLLRRMTLEEKFWQLFMIPDDTAASLARLDHGVFGLQVRGAGARATAERVNTLQRFFVEKTRLGIPIIPFDEALHGLTQGGATAFPQAIGLAATWDTALMTRVTAAVARETRSRGLRQVLSPVLNIASDVRWGRVEETYGEDPYLAGLMGLAFVRAFESAGVVTTLKHFIANVGDGGRDSYPINLSERLLDELYFPPFELAIRRGGARSVMASYNSVNGSPATANHWLLTTKLRNEWGFRGFVIADAGAVGGANVLHLTSPDYATSGKLALEAGLDVLFQTSAGHSKLFWPAFENQRIAPAVIDSAVARVLRAKFELGLFEHPYADVATAQASATAEHRALALEAAGASFTLLRNERSTLPLSKALRRIAVIGVDAAEARLGGYSGPGTSKVSMLDGIREKLGPGTAVEYEPGPGRGAVEFAPIPSADLEGGLKGEYFDNISLTGPPRLTRTDPVVDFRWTFAAPDTALSTDWYSVRWTGMLTPTESGTIRVGVDGDDGFRLYLDDKLLIDNWNKISDRTLTSEVRLERQRRYKLRLEYFENTGNARIRLIWNRGAVSDWPARIERAVGLARRSEAAIVVAGIEEGEFRDRASLDLPGHQEELIRRVAGTGKPVTVVLVAGSAVTMTGWIDQVGAVVVAWYPGEAGGRAMADLLFGDLNPSGRLPVTFPRAVGQVPLSYWHLPTGRGDDYEDLSGRPLFPFGFGLSYSTFEYSGLEIAPAEIAPNATGMVRCRVKNAGTRSGDEVVQLYLRAELSSLARPVMELAGFERVHLAPGEERVVTFRLGPERLGRPGEPGAFRIMVGASSADIRLRGILTVSRTAR